MHNDLAIAYWRGVFNALKVEDNVRRREDLLSMAVGAAARHRIVFDVTDMHPHLDEIRKAFERYPDGLRVLPTVAHFDNPFSVRAVHPLPLP